MIEHLVINEENFGLYFRDANKTKKQEGDLVVSYRADMNLPDCQLKRDVIRLLSEVDGGATMAVEALCRYAAASKQNAIKLCSQISSDLLKGHKPEVVASRNYQYEIVLFFYIKPEHLPQAWFIEKNTRWSLVPDEITDQVNI